MGSAGKNELEIGRVLQLNGYDNPKFAIIECRGIDPKWQSYGARYWTINLETKQKRGYSAYELKFLSEKKDNPGIGVFITDEFLTPDEVLDLYQQNQAQVKLEEVAKVEKENFRAREREELKKSYSNLICGETIAAPQKTLSSAALGAKNIRIELKKAFPKVKFSIRSKYFANGSSIDVDWTDGPTTDQVDKILNKYEYGTFDGMTDCYNYSNDQFPDLFGGAKYVMGQRRSSDEAYDAAARALGINDAVFNSKSGSFDNVDYQTNEMIKRETWAREFYNQKGA